MIKLGVDIGGTFTDFVCVDTSTGAARVWKTLTTPEDPGRAVIQGVQEFLDSGFAAAADVGLVVHGTTLVANALIERKGARTGLIGTLGHRDTLEIGREMRFDIYDLFLERPEPLVPRDRRLAVKERLNAAGAELIPLDEASVRAAALRLRRLRVDSVAVSLLHSYANQQHELAVERLLAEVLPGIPVSLSSRVAPVLGEYERTSTTAANAFVQPLMAAYLARLETALGALVPHAAFYVMLSNGGLAAARVAERIPVQLVESGPAAGTLAACRYAEGTGHSSLIAFDMGGTTAKMSVIEDGVPDRAHEMEVARRARFKRGSGIPLLVPTVRLIEIGAGGGSIAHADNLGLLKVGPESAGADPGPACYGLGGTRPTVTDANLVLGYLDPDHFLGGRMHLDRKAAERALAGLGAELSLDVVALARGIHDLVNESMAQAARRHVTERGLDPSRHALIAFGGSGPVHAYGLARRLKIGTIICPPAAGAASALGCLVAPANVELARSRVTRLGAVDRTALRALFDEMQREATTMLAAAGVAPTDMTFTRSADLRYVGQGFEIPVAVPAAFLAGDGPALVASFTAAYERLFSRSLPGVEVEATTWRLLGSGPHGQVDVRSLAVQGGSGVSLLGGRPVHFSEAGGFLETPVYDRYSLRSGEAIAGPAVLQERESAVILGPGAAALVDSGQNVVMTLTPPTLQGGFRDVPTV